MCILVVSFMLTVFASGCGKKEIFINEDAKYELTALTDKELEDDIYYVKDGADFYEAHKANGTASGIVNEPSSKRVLWLNKDMTLVPSLYKDELIAYPSEKTRLDSIKLERLSEVGWSFGFYGGYIDEDGYICYSIRDNCIEGSDAYEKIEGRKSDSIRIVSINDTPVTADSINDAGIITGLEKGGQYVVGLYSGTYYGTVTLTADHFFLESYEVMTISKAFDTKNGYLAIYMNEDFKSGWYCINGSGIFKYYAYEKGEASDEETDMNIEYYETMAETMDAYSQQYVASVTKKTENVRFSVFYETDVYQDEEVIAVLTSPDGTQYGMTAENGEAYTEISEVIAGRWKISIMPQDLAITNVKTESTKINPDAVSEEKEFVITEDDANIRFFATYEGDGEVWGIIENQNGESRVLDVDIKNRTLSTTYSYMPAGTYKVSIYHYADTKVTDIGYGLDESKVDEEIITVTE